MPSFWSPAIRQYRIAALLLLLAIVLTWTGLLNNFSRLFYDQFIRYSSHPAAEDIVIVAIDQRSLGQLGRWPWPRRLHAELLQKLASFQPKVIALDVIFSEPDTRAPHDDRLLAEAIAESGPVVLPVLLEQASQSALLRETLPLDMFSTAAAGLGHVDTEIDSDGVVRLAFLKAGMGEAGRPILALAMLRASGYHMPDTVLTGERDPYPELADGSVWSRDYRVLVPFSGPPGHFQQVSFVDVLSGQASPSLFKDKYVLVGAIATGLGDTVPTPVSALGQPMPGVEFNAHVLDGLLRERLIERVSMPLEYSINILSALACAVLFTVPGVAWLSLLALLLVGTSLLVSYLGIALWHTWFPPGAALVTILLAFVLFNWQRLERLLRMLFEERLRMQTALTSLVDAVIRCDHSGRVEELNQAAERLSGLSAAQALGRPLEEVLQLRTREEKLPYPVDQLVGAAGQQRPDPLVLTSSKGTDFLVQIAATPLPSMDNRQAGTVLVITDISEAERLANEIIYQQTHNGLTALPNWVLICDGLQDAIARAQSSGRLIVIIHIDIDRFTKVNESLGKKAGDLLLRQLAGRLQSFVYRGKIVGHLGSDEFILVLEDVPDGDSVVPLADAVRGALGQSVKLSGEELHLSFTLGVSIYPQDGQEADTLLLRANTAMHRGKESGRNRTEFFTGSMQAQVERLHNIEQLLHEAVEKNRLLTLYQPLIDAETLQIVGVEALMRLRDEDGEIISPDEFISLAEESGAIISLGHHQLDEACHQLTAWQEQGIESLRLSYNLSPRQLEDPDLVTGIRQILNSSGLAPHWLEFEITENLLLENDALIAPVLEKLRVLGAEFAIDDFGTGYSSMSYLTRFPFHRLKIDKSLVWDLANKPGSRAITSAIISMAHNLKMQVIAEGVEIPAQRETLLSQGCDELQGFLLGRPMSSRQFAEYYKRNKGLASVEG